MADKPFWVNLLDMGDYTYGDSIVVNHPDVKILIDGGYSGLAEDKPGVDGIPSQLTSILGNGPPFQLDLLVVTHCHGDHIGCLPRLVSDGVLEPTWALVADPNVGFPTLPDVDSVPIRTDLIDLLSLAVRDEPHGDLPEDELLAYLEDQVTLEEKYRGMLEDLAAMNTTVLRYGRDSLTAFKAHFGPLGLKILGPTYPHLERCRDYLRQLLSDAVTQARGLLAVDGAVDSHARADLYRSILGTLFAEDAALAEDRPGRGAALNDQSIVLLFESAGAKALLTGDMQLAKAEVPDLDDAMESLLDKLEAEAPFDLLKVAHHSSYNGLDRDVFDRLPARVYGHTGGQGSRSHPHRDVLRLLENHASDREWVRTDRNGRVGIGLGHEPIRLYLSRGTSNDYRPPLAADTPQPPAEASSLEAEGAVGGLTPTVRQTLSADVVEVTARLPLASTRVTLTIEVDPGDVAATIRSVELGERQPATRGSLADGRAIPRLLFVSSPRLGSALGSEAEARAIRQTVRQAGHELLDDVPSEPEMVPQAVAMVQRKLASLAAAKPVHGVVLLGNYDVVPAVAMDVLDAELRSIVSIPDQDRFVVWSDDPYGDLDDDGIPELAVSRVLHEPGSSDLMWRSLSSSGPRSSHRFGIRNRNRPFAEDIFALVPGDEPMLVSAPTTVESLEGGRQAGAGEYFMLHGSASDATLFWGEDAVVGDGVEAFHLRSVPADFLGVVFAGCCWGALSVTEPAGWRSLGQPVVPRTRENSIAVRYLAAGASAFVGCTGTHYSPGEEPYTYFGAPFHQVFWTFIQAGHPAALALRQTKNLYAASIPHISGSREYTAVELKILQQFTCLGLGW